MGNKSKKSCGTLRDTPLFWGRRRWGVWLPFFSPRFFRSRSSSLPFGRRILDRSLPFPAPALFETLGSVGGSRCLQRAMDSKETTPKGGNPATAEETWRGTDCRRSISGGATFFTRIRRTLWPLDWRASSRGRAFRSCGSSCSSPSPSFSPLSSTPSSPLSFSSYWLPSFDTKASSLPWKDSILIECVSLILSTVYGYLLSGMCI